MTTSAPELLIEVREENLCRIDADCAVLSAFEDQRPLRGGVGLVDWRLCGRLSQLLQRELLGAHWVLLPSEGRLRVPRVLVGAMGSTHALDSPTLAAFARDAGQRALALGARSILWDLALAGPALTPENAAASVLEGFSAALEGSSAGLVLRLCVPPEEGLRWRVAVERAIARRSRGATSLRLAPSGEGKVREPAVPQAARRAP